MSLRSDCSRASVGGQCPITARPSHVLVGTRRIEEGVRGSGDRLWAILHNWTLMTANGLAANQRRLTPKGRATRDRIVAVAAQLMFEHGVGSTSLADVQEGPELVLRRSTTRGSPAQGRPRSFGCSPSGCGSRRHPAWMVRLPREPPKRPLACAAAVNPYVTLVLKATRLKKLRPFSGSSMMRAPRSE